MASPLITIGVLNHNGDRYLSKTIPPLLAQKYPRYQVLIYDNHSTDASLDYLSSLSDPRLSIIKSLKNTGYCRAKNELVKRAQGEYVLLLDEDTIITSDSLLEDLVRIHTKESAGFVTTALVNQGESKTPYIGGFWNLIGYAYRPTYSLDKIRDYLKKYIKCHSTEGQLIFFKRSHFIELGSYDTHQPYFLDVGDLTIRSQILTIKPNICLLNHIGIHLGVDRKTDTRQWAWKLSYMYPGTMRILIKNFTLPNILKYSIPITLFYFFGSCYQAIKRRSPRVLTAYFWSVWFFLRSLKDTLEHRRQIQKRRVVDHDYFLTEITRPQFR